MGVVLPYESLVARLGAGDALGAHVGQHVSVVAFVERAQPQDPPLLRIERFTAHQN